MSNLRTGIAITLLAIMVSGCAEQSAVSNRPDHFSYGGQVAGKTGTDTFTWRNNQGAADVQWGGQVGKGSMTITIYDASGRQVFSDSQSGQSQSGVSGSTQSGTVGDWEIKLSFDDYTGQMGLTVRAKPGAGSGGFGGFP